MRKGIGSKDIMITGPVYRKIMVAQLIVFVKEYYWQIVPQPVSEPTLLKPHGRHSILVFIRDSMADGTGCGTYPQR
jgi:hypothetical protein